MANFTFNNCTVTIKQHVDSGAHGVYNDYGTDLPHTDLPPELATPAAMELWKKSQEMGWIDENYQPLISKAKAALLADFLGRRLQLTSRWIPFSKLWNTDSLRKDFDRASCSIDGGNFIDLLNTTFKS